MSSRRLCAHRILICSSCIAGIAAFNEPQSIAAPLPIVAGPAFAPGIGGYQPAVDGGGDIVNNSGLAVGNATKRNAAAADLGRRAIRFDASGWTELGISGASATQSTSVAATGINASGTTVGRTEVYNASHGLVRTTAVRWAAGTITPTLLDSPDSTPLYAYSEAWAINNAGVIAGNAQRTSSSATLPVRWTAASTHATELGTLNSGTGSVGAVNAAGTIIGVSERSNPQGESLGNRAVRWALNSTAPTELAILSTGPGGYTVSSPSAINDSGTIVGWASKYDGTGNYLGGRPARWDASGTAITELGLLSVKPDGFGNSVAYGLNAGGTIVGYAQRYDAQGNDLGARPVRWAAGGTAVVELGNLGTAADGTTSGSAGAINAMGYAAGGMNAYDPTNGSSLGGHATLWRPDGSALDLNSLITPGNGWTLRSANDISDTGFVTGTGDLLATNESGAFVAYYRRMFTMLIPEAGTYGQGDVTFDTKVDFSDLLLLAKHYGQSNAARRFDVGDVDLNGSVNFNDLLTLAKHYGTSASSIAGAEMSEAFAADWTLAQSLVPEPSFALAALLLAMPRRQRR